MQVEVIATRHQATAAAVSAGPLGRIWVTAQQARGQVKRKCGFANGAGTRQKDGVRCLAEDHGCDLGQGTRLAASCGALHG
jgi:hypothetical protein